MAYQYKYSLSFKTKEMVGVIPKEIWLDSEGSGTLEVVGRKEDFEDIVGKNFEVTGRLDSLTALAGIELGSILQRHARFEDEKITVDSLSVEGEVDNHALKGHYAVSIAKDLKRFDTVTITLEGKGLIGLLLSKLVLVGDGTLQKVEVIPDPVSPVDPTPPPVDPTPPPVDPTTPPVDATPPYRASFLLNDARTRVMNYLSHKHNDMWRRQIRTTLLERGDTVIYLYLSNRGDGPEVSPYRGQRFGHELDMDRIQQWHRMLRKLREIGLMPVFWFFADDSADISRARVETQKLFISDMVREFDRYALHWVLALEADEHMDLGRVKTLATHLRSHTNKPIGIHQLTSRWEWAREVPEVDYLYYQYGWGKSAGQLESETRDVLRRISPKKLIGAEYNKSSDNKAQGEAILRGGAEGYGNGRADAHVPTESPAPPVPPEKLPFELADVKWLHTDVANWAITSKLEKVVLDGRSIRLVYDKANVWPRKNVNGAEVVANPWIFVNRSGKWYGATWEWLRPGQTSKSRRAVAGDHIKRAPLNDFNPRSGEEYGFMVSGLARDRNRNVKERTNIVMFRWP
jgi:hypothetical protein